MTGGGQAILTTAFVIRFKVNFALRLCEIHMTFQKYVSLNCNVSAAYAGDKIQTSSSFGNKVLLFFKQFHVL
jgi:hypothetical protein